MASSLGSRSQPLMIIISTAGFFLSGYPLYDMTLTCKLILSGLKEDDQQFSAIYTLDDDDDWTLPDVWIKANPSLGATVSYDYMQSLINAAKNNESLATGIKTKNLNLWCQSMTTWIAEDYLLKAMSKVDLVDYPDEVCYGGVDLSSVSDLTCTSIMFPPNPDRKTNPDKFVFKTLIYIPQEAIKNSVNAPLYSKWINDGYATMTSGNVVDYDYILRDLLKINEKNYILSLAYDSWNSAQWAINATNEGLSLEPYSQALGSFNRPTKYFELLIKSDKVVIDYNPAVLWMFRNVELKYDWNDNCKPVKALNIQTNKIDATISMIESLGTYLLSPQNEPTVTAI